MPAEVDAVQIGVSHAEALGRYGFMVLEPFADVAALKAKTATLRLTRGTRVEVTVKRPEGTPERPERPRTRARA